MKKILKTLIMSALVFSLFSCAQPTQDSTIKEEQKPTGPTETEKEEQKEVENDFYVLWDNNYLELLDGQEKYFKTDFKITSSIDPKLNLLTPTTPSRDSKSKLLRDFIFDENKDLYYLESIPDSFIYALKKIPYDKANNGNYNKPSELIFEKDIGENNGILCISVDKDNIYIPITYTLKNAQKTELYVLNKTTKTPTLITLSELENKIITAIEVTPNGTIYLAANNFDSLETPATKSYLYKIIKNGETYEIKTTVDVDKIPDDARERIVDMQYIDNSLYLMICNNRNAVPEDSQGNHKLYSHQGGGIVKVTDNGNNLTLGNIIGFNSKNYAYLDGQGTIYAKPTENTDFFYHPTKFIAIKPKQLVIADEGFFEYVNEEDKKAIKANNSIVFMDIIDGEPKFNNRVIMENINFSQSNSNISSGYYDTTFDF